MGFNLYCRLSVCGVLFNEKPISMAVLSPTENAALPLQFALVLRGYLAPEIHSHIAVAGPPFPK